MVATTPRQTPYRPWYQRWELPTLVPGVLLAAIMVWSVVQSIAVSNWAEGLEVLSSVALPGLLVGMLFARLFWLPGWLAHLLSAALGLAWAIQRIGPLLARQITYELGAPLADRLATWGERAAEILIRTVIWLRILQAGGRGEDIVLFVVVLALLAWALGYVTGWLLFRAGWVWWAVVLNAVMILVNYTFTAPKPNTLFFVFLGTALLLVAYQNVAHQQQLWRSALIEYPDFLPWRFVLAAALFCAMVVFITSLLPSNVSSAQIARAWRVISSPFTAVRQSWEDAFSTINAPPGMSGGGFVTRSVRVGGARALGNEIVMLVRSSRFEYWRAVTFDKYSGRGWQSTVGERARAALGLATPEQARTEVEAGVALPPLDLSGHRLVTQTVQVVQQRNDNLLMLGGQLYAAGVPVLVQHSYLLDEAGQPRPNFLESSAIFAEAPLQQTQVYTAAAWFSVADEQSLREAGTDYPSWVVNHYVQLPETVTPRTRAKAQEIAREAGATNPYDQAKAFQEYLRQLTYNERRPAPPENRDWVDHFLFEGQRGYCDDFATTMVVLLRSLNIPARWVQGYAGGTLDSQVGAYVVRESVAHSWPEVYFPGFGWQRFEPTPASYTTVPVRPVTPDTESAGGGGAPFGGLTDPDELQRELMERERLSGSGGSEALQRLLAERAAQERTRRLVIGGGILAAVLGVAGLFALSLRREVQGLAPAAAAYARLSRLATWAGMPPQPEATPFEYATDLGRHIPEQREPIDRLTRAYVAERYGATATRDGHTLEADWRALRRTLLGRLAGRLTARRPPARQQPRRRNGRR